MDSDLQDLITPVALEELPSAYDTSKKDHQTGAVLEKEGQSYSHGIIAVRLTEGRLVQIIDVCILDTKFYSYMLILPSSMEDIDIPSTLLFPTAIQRFKPPSVQNVQRNSRSAMTESSRIAR
jgi:hypothetical protein